MKVHHWYLNNAVSGALDSINLHLKRCSCKARFKLRLLTECFILVASAMFGATFNLATRVELS